MLRRALLSSVLFVTLTSFNACSNDGGPTPPGARRTPVGFCGTAATIFKVGVQSFDPTADEDVDAGTEADAEADADASADASPADDAGSSDAGAGTGGPPFGDAGSKRRQTLFALGLRATTSGISLKRATFKVMDGVPLLSIRQSEFLAELDLDTTGESTFIVNVEVDQCGGGASGTTTLVFTVTQLGAKNFSIRVNGDNGRQETLVNQP